MARCPTCQREWIWRHGLLRLVDNTATADGRLATLSVLESYVVAALIKRPMKREQLIMTMYPDGGGGPLSADKCLSVRLGRIRKKLRPLGFTVENINKGIWGNAIYALKKIELEAT